MKFVIYGKSSCPNCEKAKMLCDIKGYSYEYRSIEKDGMMTELTNLIGEVKSVPQVFKVCDNGVLHHVGGYEQLRKHS